MIRGSFLQIRERLTALCRRGKVFSIFAIQSGEELRDFAKRADSVPVFIVRDVQEARGIVAGLRRSPFKVVERAINGPYVMVRFLEGRPS